MIERIRRGIFNVIEAPLQSGNRWSRVFDAFMMVLIVLNVISVILATEASFALNHGLLLIRFYRISILLFTIEYFLRLWVCTLKDEYNHPIYGRIKYILSPLALIDLISILPFFTPGFIRMDLRGLRAIRLIRIFSIFKVSRYSNSVNLMIDILKTRKEQLFISFFLLFLVLFLASSFLYSVEHDVQPSKFHSISRVMYWSLMNLGGGDNDIRPITAWGKFLASIISLLSICFIAIPSGIISSEFIESLERRKPAQKGVRNICPYCGELLSNNPNLDKNLFLNKNVGDGIISDIIQISDIPQENSFEEAAESSSS